MKAAAWITMSIVVILLIATAYQLMQTSKLRKDFEAALTAPGT